MFKFSKLDGTADCFASLHSISLHYRGRETCRKHMQLLTIFLNTSLVLKYFFHKILIYIILMKIHVVHGLFIYFFFNINKILDFFGYFSAIDFINQYLYSSNINHLTF